MKYALFYWFILLGTLFTSCKKTGVENPPLPNPLPIVEMNYIDLKNREITGTGAPLVVDINNDGSYDLIFSVMLVGDPINKIDKTQFNVISSLYTFLPVNANEQVPAMTKSEDIPIDDFAGNNWYNASGITLIEKNEFATGTIVWRGNWLRLSKRYLPIQVMKNERRYNGWVEISADDLNERLVIHRAAIGKKPETKVKAGL